jgi:hypothetical protein
MVIKTPDMPDIDPIEVSNLDICGNAPLEWSRAREQLANWHGPRTFRISFARPGPTVTPCCRRRRHAVGR